jgi:uncharacterized phage protein (TIGR01671 family)
MNRNIKFRVWCNTTKHFTDIPFYSCGGGQILWHHTGDQITISNIDDGDYVIQQYTGLKGKNGKEIYEGDIISYWPSCAKGYNNTIVKVPELTAFHWFAELEMMLDKSEYPNQCEIEVIGNIFENPNLLDNTSKIKNRIKLKKFS